jgi:FlgN protein
MTATALPDPLLTADLLVHLDAQLASTERLLEIVLAQGAAIRARDVDAVVRHVSGFQAELQRRARIEEDRTRLLLRAGAALGMAPETVTLSQLTARMTPDEAERAHHRSAELQQALGQLQREHSCNQALMRQELAFLDHLLRLVDPTAPVAYEPGGTRVSGLRSGGPTARSQLDLQA